MSVIVADSVINFYFKASAARKELNGAENLKDGTMPSLSIVNVQESMPKLASRLMNQYMQLNAKICIGDRRIWQNCHRKNGARKCLAGQTTGNFEQKKAYLHLHISRSKHQRPLLSFAGR